MCSVVLVCGGMIFKSEFTNFTMSVRAGFKERSGKQKLTNQQKLWPPVLSIVVVAVIALAIVLLPFDATLSRLAFTSQIWPVPQLRKLTDLVLATPYIVLFVLMILCALVARWQLRQRQKMSWRPSQSIEIYHRLGAVIGHCLFGMLAILTAGLLVNILKCVVGRPRPSLIDVVGPFAFKPFSYTYSYVSFPSGHACTAAVLATLVALWLPKYRIIAYVGLGLIASIRVAVQAHYPSDVLVGFVFGAVITLILARFLAQANLLFRFEPGRVFPVVKKNSGPVI